MQCWRKDTVDCMYVEDGTFEALVELEHNHRRRFSGLVSAYMENECMYCRVEPITPECRALHEWLKRNGPEEDSW